MASTQHKSQFLSSLNEETIKIEKCEEHQSDNEILQKALEIDDNTPVILERAANDVGECSCSLSDKVSRLIGKNEKLKLKTKTLKADNSELLIKLEKLTKKNKKLRIRNESLKTANFRLQDSLTSKLIPAQENPFTELEGFPDNKQILKFSQEAGNSDYSFIRLLMHSMWPGGFQGRSVTGRMSNNPGGSSGKSETSTSHEKRIPLEKDKVQYMKDCLYERRIYMRDGPAVASQKSQLANRYMARVIANSLREAK